MTEIIDTNTGMRSEARIEALPNANGVLTLGILSLVFMGLVGIILAIIALSISANPKGMYELDPDKYTVSSYKNLKAGRVCAIISLSVSGALLLILIMALAAS